MARDTYELKNEAGVILRILLCLQNHRLNQQYIDSID